MEQLVEGSLPGFTADGVLPPADYGPTLAALRASPLVNGHAHAPDTWDASGRLRLVENLTILVQQLWQVGIQEIFIDGSFVEEKDHPNDIDGYFRCKLRRIAHGELARELNLLDPHKVWTWDSASRRPFRNYPKRQLPMWHTYLVELYPHYGQISGIQDGYGNDLQFPAAFRRSRENGRPKGITRLVKEETHHD